VFVANIESYDYELLYALVLFSVTVQQLNWEYSYFSK